MPLHARSVWYSRYSSLGPRWRAARRRLVLLSTHAYSQVLLRFNTFFTVAARLHADADKKRVLQELAACAPATVQQTSHHP